MVVLKLNDRIKYKGKTFTFDWVASAGKGGAVVTLTENGRSMNVSHSTGERGTRKRNNGSGMKTKHVTAGNRLYRKHWLKTIDPAKRVYVYRNLHKNCWSVRQSGKVVDHTHFLLLRDCRYLVGEAGRERVRREKKKNVQCWYIGLRGL